MLVSIALFKLTHYQDVERVGHQWVCSCCAKAWAAFTRADAHLLRLFGIAC